MWSEARKQEKKLRGMMIDYKKRAERRREYYDRIKTDPAQFMQLHGRALKIHIDPVIAQQAEAASTMMPWQGNPDTIIDRFDVRAHLDVIPEYKEIPQEVDEMESQINYERYRILVQNDYSGVKENKFLNQIFLEERFGGSAQKKQDSEAEKRKIAERKVAIGYHYEDSENAHSMMEEQEPDEEDAEEEASEEEIDLDIAFDVDQIPAKQAREMNALSTTYGLAGTEFIDQLVQDKADLEKLRNARAEEEERAATRRNRRDRRRAREQARARDLNTIRTGDTGISMGLPAYAAVPVENEDKQQALLLREKSSSRSPSPDHKDKVCFITSFGGDSGDEVKASPLRRHRSRSRSPRRSRRRRSSSSSSDDSVSSRERRRRKARRANQRKTSSSSSSRSRQRSSSPKPGPKLPTPPRKSYYRHDLKSDASSDGLSQDELASQSSDRKDFNNHHGFDKKSGDSNNKPQGKLAPQERLRRKMQAMLRKTHQTDQLARIEKEEKAREEREHRKELLKEHLAKYRPEDRYNSGSESDNKRLRSSSRDWSRSRSRSRSRERRRKRSRSRSRTEKRRSGSRERKKFRRSRSRSRSRRSPRDRRDRSSSDRRDRREWRKKYSPEHRDKSRRDDRRSYRY